MSSRSWTVLMIFLGDLQFGNKISQMLEFFFFGGL